MTLAQLTQYAEVLKLLRNSKGYLPLSELAQALYEKAEFILDIINSLISNGYPISMHPDGYALTESTDQLFPWEFENRMDTIHYFQEIDSTMTICRKMAKAGCPPFNVVIAERQTQGRGRLKRIWLSNDGGLYFTVVLRPNIPPWECGRINFLASVVLSTLLQKVYAIPAGVKWPNDILVNGQKIAGLLSEMDTVGDVVESVCLGIGLNVNNDPSPIEPNATSLKALLGKDIQRAPLLNLFLEHFEEGITNMHWEETLNQWRRLSITLNHRVKVTTAVETVEGEATDVDDTGALLVRLTDGTIKKVIYGDCFIQPPSS